MLIPSIHILPQFKIFTIEDPVFFCGSKRIAVDI